MEALWYKMNTDVVSLLCKAWCSEESAGIGTACQHCEETGPDYNSPHILWFNQTVPLSASVHRERQGYEKGDILTVMGMFSIFLEVKKKQLMGYKVYTYGKNIHFYI